MRIMSSVISKIIQKFNKYCVDESQKNEFVNHDNIIKFLKNTFSLSFNNDDNDNDNDKTVISMGNWDLFNEYSKVCNFLTKTQTINDTNTLILIIQSFLHVEKKGTNNEDNKNNNIPVSFEQLYNCIISGIHEYFKVKLTEMKDAEVGIVLLEYKKKSQNGINYNIRREYFKKDDKCFIRKIMSCSRKEKMIAERKAWKPFNINANECSATFENITLEINPNLNKEVSNSTNLLKNTTLEKESGSKPLRVGIKCRNCGTIGHFTHDCPNPQTINSLNTRKSFNEIETNNSENNKYVAPNQRPYYSVIVNHISSDSTVDEITNLFSEAGRVQRVTIPKGYDGLNRNFCFVNFYSEESVERAIKRFNGTGLNSMIMTVEKAKSKY